RSFGRAIAESLTQLNSEFKSQIKKQCTASSHGRKAIHLIDCFESFTRTPIAQSGSMPRRALRHSDVGTTALHYLDKRSRATTGLGALLSTFRPIDMAKDLSDQPPFKPS